MGLFDYVNCDYPLPGNPPSGAQAVPFQTKDLTCFMMSYRITEDGRIVESGGTEDWSSFTGTVDLDWSNVVASGPGIYTEHGEDALYLEYRAVFVDGKLTDIKEISNRREPAAKRRARAWSAPSEADVARRKARQGESLLGRSVFVQFGGSSPGFHSEVVAENSSRIVVSNGDDFEVLHRSDRDHLFFDSEEESIAYTKHRKDEWDRERSEYEQEIGATRTIQSLPHAER